MGKLEQKILSISDTLDILHNSLDLATFYIEFSKNIRYLIEYVIFKLYINELKEEHGFSFDVLRSKAIPSGKRSSDKFYKEMCFLHDQANVVGHQIVDEDGAVLMMLKYYPYLKKIRSEFKNRFSINILQNLESYYPQADDETEKYYSLIAQKVFLTDDELSISSNEKYYVIKERPIFYKNKSFYEITIRNVLSKSKFDNFVVFSPTFLPKNYSLKMSFKNELIPNHNQDFLITIVVAYSVSIRGCEFDNLRKIFGDNSGNSPNTEEIRFLEQYLTNTKSTLLDLISLPDDEFNRLKSSSTKNKTNSSHKIFNMLESARIIIKGKKPGTNILSFLLYKINNKLIKDQLSWKLENNKLLSGLCLSWNSIPFDNLPFAFSPAKHIISVDDVFECIDFTGHEDELLYKRLSNNTESNSILYTDISEVDDIENIKSKADEFNKKLYYKHRPDSEIGFYNNYAYIKGYESTGIEIIKKIKQLTSRSIQNYTSIVSSLIENGMISSDSEEKIDCLKKLFSSSSVAVVFGPAGTGKTTFIHLVSQVFIKSDIVLLANTNAAVNNLKMKTYVDWNRIMTIEKFLKSDRSPNVVIIDESSTVSNSNILDILNKIDLNKCVLLFVGDEHQITSINYGNWFLLVRDFLSKDSKFELTYIRRTDDDNLLSLWKSCRNADGKVGEILAVNGMTHRLAAFSFKMEENDSVVLCLNYDGLYGVNNINRIMQMNNNNKEYIIGDGRYKIDDPIIFSESNKYSDFLNNNTKGIIKNIIDNNNYIRFVLDVNRVFNDSIDNNEYPFEILESTKEWSRIAIDIYKNRNSDNDEDENSTCIVPFQVSYAITVHKAQGLEYENVRVVISDSIEELVTSNIFYTAITRARKSLGIYWNADVASEICNRLQSDFSNDNDIRILKSKYYKQLYDGSNN